MFDVRIVRIDWAVLPGRRPRMAGMNARLSVHGQELPGLIMRLETEDGHVGTGWSNCPRDKAGTLLGKSLKDVFVAGMGPGTEWKDFEFPLWDLVARMSGQSVRALLTEWRGKANESAKAVPCYDTSLYIDDLHLDDDAEAVALIQEEARFGYENGHRAFKIKVGRGARHMPLEAGTVRDIAVIRGVRAAVGPECTIMIDANNGYNLNIDKRVLAETADADLFWLEEAFHEDPVLYEDLQQWLQKENLDVHVADGEGGAAPALLDWARDGLINVVQYDIFSYGFTNWLQLGPQLDAWNVLSAPHHYGRVIGNYVTGHLMPAIAKFGFVEWDEAATTGLEPGYAVHEGLIRFPETGGFGLELDRETLQKQVAANGYRCSLA